MGSTTTMVTPDGKVQTMVPVTPVSPRFSLNSVDGKKIVRGACYALAGALLTYLVGVVGNTNFIWNGINYTPTVVAVFSVISSTAYKFLDGNSK